MQTESCGMRQDMATEAHAAYALAEQREETAEQRSIPRNPALTGLAVAIPISSAIWTVIALGCWLLLR